MCVWVCARVRRSKYLSYLQPYLAREFWRGGVEWKKRKAKKKSAKATEEGDDDSDCRLMMHKAAKQLAGPQQAGVLSFCVCAPCS